MDCPKWDCEGKMTVIKTLDKGRSICRPRKCDVCDLTGTSVESFDLEFYEAWRKPVEDPFAHLRGAEYERAKRGL